MAEDLTRKISEALGALAGETPLREGAKGLLNALGYETHGQQMQGPSGNFWRAPDPKDR